jgi:hypothetical protein
MSMKSLVTVEEWVARFKAIGLDKATMEKWHHLLTLPPETLPLQT